MRSGLALTSSMTSTWKACVVRSMRRVGIDICHLEQTHGLGLMESHNAPWGLKLDFPRVLRRPRAGILGIQGRGGRPVVRIVGTSNGLGTIFRHREWPLVDTFSMFGSPNRIHL